MTAERPFFGVFGLKSQIEFGYGGRAGRFWEGYHAPVTEFRQRSPVVVDWKKKTPLSKSILRSLPFSFVAAV